ncbi:prepilin-type N-terminal cleavage/methylation domain-containing protein [Candidatus Peregrinibacteria bacterium]|nr:prepilin-type N-terminal cleavage/methylation domain-containing protein [Candidatus Peregrinibacteria bacterium]
MKQGLSKKKGFTLVEILIVLGVISMVVLLGVSSYGVARKKVKLDIAANSLHSSIVEAREKTRAGYYDSGSGTVTGASSLCFGFSLTEGGFIQSLYTPYDRLAAKGSRCPLNDALPVTKQINRESDIVIKNIQLYGNEVSDSITLFFAPPDARIEVEEPLITTDEAKMTVVIGYEDSDSDLDKRQVIFDLLTGNVNTQTYTNNDTN